MNLARMMAASVAPRVSGLLQTLAASSRPLHLLARPLPLVQAPLLQPATPVLVPSCGMKVRGLLKRRCKDCYFVYRDRRKFVMCKTHPRHKAAAFAPREKFTWVLSPGPMQGKQRPW